MALTDTRLAHATSPVTSILTALHWSQTGLKPILNETSSTNVSQSGIVCLQSLLLIHFKIFSL